MNHLPQGYELDTRRSIRNDKDISVNEHGQQLLHLCTATKMKILKRQNTDRSSKSFTYVGFHACSAVDPALASEISLVKARTIQHLFVMKYNYISDHKPILLRLPHTILTH